MYKLNSYNFGDFFRKIRKSKKISAIELGKLINKTDSTIYKYERNEIVPDWFTILDICNALDVSINEFVENEKIEQSKDMSVNYLDTNIIYLYYLGRQHTTMFTLEIEKYADYQKVYFKNKDGSILYIGTLEASHDIAYINMQNYFPTNKKFEKIQMVINLKIASDNKFIGIITGTDDVTNAPILKKCMLSKTILTSSEIDELDDRLSLTNEELEKARKERFLTSDISNRIDYEVVKANS